MNKAKQVLKNIIGKGFSKFNYPIIVNSYGRSGSTVLNKSIIESSIELNYTNYKDLAFRSISNEAWDLDAVNFKDGFVYKTHDYPSKDDLKKNIRMLYTFANPVDVVLSLQRLYQTKGEQWMKQHYDHLKVQYNDFENIVYNDDLYLERHLDSWLKEKRCPIAFIRYEDMWDYQSEISSFLGFKVTLPPYRERKANKEIEEKKIKTIEKSYSSLIKKLENLDSFFTNGFQHYHIFLIDI